MAGRNSAILLLIDDQLRKAHRELPVEQSQLENALAVNDGKHPSMSPTQRSHPALHLLVLLAELASSV